MKDLVKRLEIGIEEILLAILIMIEILDFFTIIPAPVEYVEKVVALMAMTYLFYKASMTRIIFGIREKNYDLMIAVSFLLLSMKTIIGFLISAVYEESILRGFYQTIISNASVIEKTGFWIGSIILIIISAMLVKEKISKPCIMRIIHEEKPAKTLPQKMVRFITTYLILLAIFVVLFTFAIEWLGITVDAPILVTVLFFYLFIIVKRGKNMRTESFLWKVSSSSESFYENFISMFHSRKSILNAISGLLVLHLLVEIGHFIIPYTTGLLYPWYFKQLGPGHSPLHLLMANDFTAAGTMLTQAGVLIIYFLNVLAALMLFFGPAYAWSHIYESKNESKKNHKKKDEEMKKKVHIPNISWLFFGSLAVFIMEPVFRMRAVESSTLIGADITTQQIPVIQNIGLVLISAALISAIFYILGKKNLTKTIKLCFLSIFIYFGIYIYYFFTDLARFYVDAVRLMFIGKEYFIAAHLLIFFTITIMFYTIGYFIFLYETYSNQKI